MPESRNICASYLMKFFINLDGMELLLIVVHTMTLIVVTIICACLCIR